MRFAVVVGNMNSLLFAQDKLLEFAHATQLRFNKIGFLLGQFRDQKLHDMKLV